MLLIVLSFVISVAIIILAEYASGCDPLYMFSGRKVVLVMYHGGIKYSRRHKNGQGYLFPANKIGPMIMKEDGTIEGSIIVTSWFYY